jgi:hypothetical protein
MQSPNEEIASTQEPVSELVEVDDIAEPLQITTPSTVEVAPTDVSAALETEFDPMLFVQLGDRIVIDSEKYGRTVGTVYYRSLENIHIKPDGVSNMLHTFEIEQTEEEEIYKEDYGVTAIYIIEKRSFGAFVELQNFKIDQIIDTFSNNSSDSNNSTKQYKIIQVDADKDSIMIEDKDDLEYKHEVLFDFIGIPLDEDFRIISIRHFTGVSNSNPNAFGEEPIEQNKSEESEESKESEEPNESEEDGIEIIGYIEVKEARVFKEIPMIEQRIPDSIQKIDALNDFINGIDSNRQKDPKVLRNIRILVETLFYLKQQTIEFEENGGIIGPKQVSAQTLHDLVQSTYIPLGRPVLEMKKKLYSVDEDEDEDEDVNDENIMMKNFINELNSIKEYGLAAAVNQSGVDGAEWNSMRHILSTYMSPWKNINNREDADPANIWKAYTDSDVYRQTAPHIGNSSNFDPIAGYIAPEPENRKMSKDTGNFPPPVLDEIPFGVERALAITYRKAGKKDNEKRVERITKMVLVDLEKSALASYLLYPQSVVSHMGSTRSKQLAIDSGRSAVQPMLLRDILRKVGNPTETGTSRNITLFESGTLGDISLEDYIDGLTVPALAMGDTFVVLDQYGMENIELTEEVLEVLQNKITEYQSNLLASLKGMRATLQEERKQEVVQYLENISFMERLRAQPILLQLIEEYKQYHPNLSDSDIGIINYLMKKNNVYFQVAVGQNPVLLAKANLDANNLNYLENLRVATLIREKQKTIGLRPRKNHCPHVANFVSIRKISNDDDRFQEMINTFKLYQGHRVNNWINCNNCKENLMCIHERLQMQAFINPKEKNIIEKEIILKFSGGQFQGNYICRNCGQIIKSLDFDNSIEFDDDGKPKSGRSILVDEDALFEERLDQFVAPSPEKQNEEIKLTEDEVVVYQIIKEISERIGVKLELSAFRRVIINVLEYLKSILNEARYARQKAKAPAMPDYQVYLARQRVCVSALFVLIEIQTKIPSYNARFVIIDCKSPGFNGYPLVEEETNQQGIQYLACAVASIKLDMPPWNQTGYMRIADENRLQKGIVAEILNILKTVIKDDMIQYQLSQKRKHLSTADDTKKQVATYSQENIPATFLPQQVVIRAKEAAESQITPEIVKHMGEKGEISLVRLWIRQAHILARETANLVRGSPFIETTCCVSPANEPQKYWADNVLPDLKGRKINPKVQAPFLMPNFIPRQSELDVVEPDKEQYYAIFLKYCYQGVRIGHPHEPGLTHHCLWCGFQFPTNPNIMNAATEGRAALQEYEVKTDEASFTDLLDRIHAVNRVDPVTIKYISDFQSIMEKVANIKPSPILERIQKKSQDDEEDKNEDVLDWNGLVMNMTQELIKNSAQITAQQVYQACNELSEQSEEYRKYLQTALRQKPAYVTFIESIIKLPWGNFFQVVQSYFIVPLQRLYSDFNKGGFVLQREYDLSDDHKADVMKIFEKELANLVFKSEINSVKSNKELLKLSIKYLIDQFVAIMPLKHILNRDYIPGNEVSLNFIKEVIFLGPLSIFIGSFSTGDKSTTEKASYSRFYYNILNVIFTKYNSEKLSYNEDEIKMLIAIRDEKERVHVVQQFDKLTDEERTIELMNKRNGTGKWSVGGTKLIYAYDKDYYDQEREKRLQAGIIDFPGGSDGTMNSPEGREYDDMGLPIFSDMELEAEGGYDNNQHRDDDNE